MRFYQECKECKKVTYEGKTNKENGQFFCDVCFFKFVLETKREFMLLSPLTLHPLTRYNRGCDFKAENWFTRLWNKFCDFMDSTNNLDLNSHSHNHN